MIGGNGDAIFARLARAMGQPVLASDQRYATHVARGAHQDALDALINEWTGTLTVDEVDALMIEYSIPPAGSIARLTCSTIRIFRRAAQLSRLKRRIAGASEMQSTFPKLSKTPSSIRRPAPAAPGQDNAEVYGERLGLDAGELARLAQAGVI